jgi:hypothetical protein
MKKIIFLASLFLAIVGAQLATPTVATAQTAFSGTTTNPTAYVKDATVDTLKLTLSGVYAPLVKIQMKLAKVSGTIAGTVRLYGSLYDSTGTFSPIGDTMTLTNITVNSHVWNLTGNDLGWKYLRILQDGGTTMAGRLQVVALAPRP